MQVGVDRTDYLMFATEIGADTFDYDKHQAEIEGAPGARFNIVYDSMCGKYCLAGKIIAQSDPYEGFELAKVSLDKVAFDAVSVAEAVSESFGRKLVPSDFSLILFSHFH